MYAKIINQETKQCDVGLGTNVEFYKSIGMTEMEVEQAYNGNWYVQGYAPAKPQSVKEEEVRAVRSQYYEEYVDWYQSKPLLWAEMTDTEKQDIADYRIYLKDYTGQEGWYNQNPMDFDTWKEQTEPQQSEE